MRRTTCGFSLLLLLILPALQGCERLPSSIKEEFAQANQLYDEKKYTEAAQVYEAILNKGIDSGIIHFNLANTFMRLGKTGQALLEYERARRLLPRNEDIARNQKYATDLVKTPDFTPKTPSATARLAERIYETFNLREWEQLFCGSAFLFLAIGEGLLLASFLRDKVLWAYGLLALTSLIALIPLVNLAASLADSKGLLIVYAGGALGAILLGVQAIRERWREGGFTVARSALLAVGIFTLFTGVAFGAKYREYRVDNHALALDPKTEVRDGPREDATITRTIPQGTRLLLTRQKDDFVEAILPDLSKGWIHTDQAGAVRVDRSTVPPPL